MASKAGKYLNIIKNWFFDLSKSKRIALTMVAVLLVTVPSVSAWYISRLNNLDRMFPGITWPGDDGDPGDDVDLNGSFQGGKIINIALLGLDNNETRSNARLKGYTGLVDTIMIVALNIETGDIDIVSIPRDTYAPIYNQGGYKDKINSANYWGWSKGLPGIDDRVEAGLKSQLETISTVLSVPIHHYVTVDMDAVIEIVDIMGGVWYNVPHRTYHTSGRIISEPGYQWFSGRRFLDFVRSRVDGGDYQRAQKQQDVMISVFEQFKKANKLVNAPQVLMSVHKNVSTNLSLEQIMALALYGTQKVEGSNISTHILEGKLTWGAIPGRPEGNNYYIIDQQLRAELVQKVWGKNIALLPQDVLLTPVKKPDPGSTEPPNPNGQNEDPHSWEPGND